MKWVALDRQHHNLKSGGYILGHHWLIYSLPKVYLCFIKTKRNLTM